MTIPHPETKNSAANWMMFSPVLKEVATVAAAVQTTTRGTQTGRKGQGNNGGPQIDQPGQGSSSGTQNNQQGQGVSSGTQTDLQGQGISRGTQTKGQGSTAGNSKGKEGDGSGLAITADMTGAVLATSGAMYKTNMGT